jgi:hypothetical protein
VSGWRQQLDLRTRGDQHHGDVDRTDGRVTDLRYDPAQQQSAAAAAAGFDGTPHERAHCRPQAHTVAEAATCGSLRGQMGLSSTPSQPGLPLLERASQRAPVCGAGGGQYQGMGRYAFARSRGREDERLAALERQLDPVSQAAIGQLGLAAGRRCWEAGAGGGSMAAWLAGRVTSSGWVLATDIDISGLPGPHPANLTVARPDLEREEAPAGGFDLIHARLVLEHLREPAAAVGKLASALRAGGWLIVEDADGLLFDAEPAEQGAYICSEDEAARPGDTGR